MADGYPCEACGKDAATEHLTEITKEGVRSLHLCKACAQQKGLTATHIDISDVIASFITSPVAKELTQLLQSRAIGDGFTSHFRTLLKIFLHATDSQGTSSIDREKISHRRVGLAAQHLQDSSHIGLSIFFTGNGCKRVLFNTEICRGQGVGFHLAMA